MSLCVAFKHYDKIFFLVVSTRVAYLVYPLGFIYFNNFTIQFGIELKRIYFNFSQLLLLTRYGNHTYIFVVSSQVVVSIRRRILPFLLLGSFLLLSGFPQESMLFFQNKNKIFCSENRRNDISCVALHLCPMGNSK